MFLFLARILTTLCIIREFCQNRGLEPSSLPGPEDDFGDVKRKLSTLHHRLEVLRYWTSALGMGWAFMLRRHFASMKPEGGKVIVVDSGQSVYRTLWISDTVVADGIKWLREDRKGGMEDVLLLGYPWEVTALLRRSSARTRG